MTLFVAILAVALICLLASALLSSYLSHREINKFVQEHEPELVGTAPIGTSPAPNGQYPLDPQAGQDPRLQPQDQGANPHPRMPPPPKPRNINLGFVLAGVLGLILALTLAFLIAGRVSRPLDGLTVATGKIADGDYMERVEIKGGKEVEELGTAFNSLAASLEKNEELRQHMVADIAHELRNPLATLRGQLELMQDGKIECSRQAVDSLLEDVVLLSRIVDDLSQLSLVDAGKLEFVYQAVDCSAVLADIKARFDHEADSTGISLLVSASEGLPAVKADPTRLAQVLGNLVGNSIAHTPEGGTITLGAEIGQREVVFSVTDTGTGILPEEIPHVFDRFYRTDKSRTRATGGAGLGLSIAKSLVEAQGGRIEASSSGEGGTTISFTIPLFED